MVVLRKVGKYLNFNPRSREGSDAVSSAEYDRIRISIHAPVKGATLRVQVLLSLSNYFNPRSREGSDIRLTNFDIHIIYFNPRSREGSDGILRYLI